MATVDPNPMESADPDKAPGAKPVKRCGAKLRKKPGKRCRTTKLMPNGRCRLHGGKTPSGPASPNWRTGARSKHRWMADMPGKMGDRFNKALADPHLANLRASMALNDALLTSYMATLKTTGKALSLAEQKRVHDLLDMQRRLAGDEARRLRDLGAMVTQAQFTTVITTCITLFTEFVTDLAARKEIHRRLQATLLAVGQGRPSDVPAAAVEGDSDGGE